MKFNSIKVTNFKGKIVFVRVDYNIPVIKNKILFDEKILNTFPTIKKLSNDGAKIILLTHHNLSKNGVSSIQFLQKNISRIFKKEIKFIPESKGPFFEKALKELKNSEILLVENVLFHDDDKFLDSKNNRELAFYWASLADAFVNDAFTISYSKDASNFGIAAFKKEKYLGLTAKKELDVLNFLIDTNINNRPSIAIISGETILEKVKEINFLLKKFDRIIVTGKLGYNFLAATTNKADSSIFTQKELEIATKFIEKRNSRIIIPVDFKRSVNSKKHLLFDIGPKSIQYFKPYILKAKKILWLGAAGNTRYPNFQSGTKALIKMILSLNEKSFTAIYGYDIVKLISKDQMNKFNHLSFNNIAASIFLQNKSLPALEILSPDINPISNNIEEILAVKKISQTKEKNLNNLKTDSTILKVKNLKVSFKTGRKKVINIIRGVDISVKKKQIIGFVGESGSGKSVTSKSLININFGSIVDAEKMVLEKLDLLKFKKEKDWAKIRGNYIGYIPQDPLTSLNPTRTIGKQLLDCIAKDSRFKSNSEKVKYIVELLESFGIRDAKNKLKSYPHTLSGGQKQRVVIAMVVARNPKIIIADEPTTALDPTVQASVLALFEKIRTDFEISIIFISHNISVVAKFCDYIYVMYAGKIVERGLKKEIFEDPRHPYTWALINSIPENKEEKLYNIRGLPPDMANLPAGDPFANRNDYALDIDFEKEPPLFWINKTHAAATWLLHPDAPKVTLDPKLQERINIFKKVFNE